LTRELKLSSEKKTAFSTNGDSTRGSFIIENSFCYPRYFVIPDEFADCPL